MSHEYTTSEELGASSEQLETASHVLAGRNALLNSVRVLLHALQSRSKTYSTLLRLMRLVTSHKVVRHGDI